MTENEQKDTEKDEQPKDKKAERSGSRRFWTFIILVLIPIVTGVGCFIVGNAIRNSTVTYVGILAFEIGVPVTMVILVAVGLILKFGGCRKPKSDTTGTTDEAPSQREHEQEMIDAVNSTSRFESRVNMADYESEHIAEGMRNAPKWGIALGLTFFFSLLALLITATVLLINRIFVGAIVCAAIVGVTLITTFIVMAVSRARATNDDISKAQRITEGKVKTCFMVGTTTTKSGGIPHGNGRTVRIHSVTYRVIVVADGQEYGAFSKRFYETDETVTIAVMGKNRAKIVENAEPEKIETE